jgi:hypothetical protein
MVAFSVRSEELIRLHPPLSVYNRFAGMGRGMGERNIAPEKTLKY